VHWAVGQALSLAHTPQRGTLPICPGGARKRVPGPPLRGVVSGSHRSSGCGKSRKARTWRNTAFLLILVVLGAIASIQTFASAVSTLISSASAGVGGS